MGRFFLPLVLFIGVIFLFFPIVIEIYTYADLNRKKFTFSFYLYKVFKVYGGYLSAYPGGFAIHTASDKVKLLPFKDMNNERKRRVKFYRAIKLKKFYLTSETGAEYMLQISSLNVFLKAVYYHFGGEKEKVETWLSDGDVLRISTLLNVSFNLFTLLILFIKTIKERYING